MKLEIMNCKYCKKTLPENKIKKNTTIASCPKCYALFDTQDKSYSKKVPQKVRCLEKKKDLKIIYRWFTWGDLLCFIGLIPINLYLFNLVFYIISNPLYTIFYPVVWFLTYFYTVRVFNKTTLEIKDKTLSSLHTPLPWIGNITIKAEEIKGIYSKEIRAKTLYYIVKGKLKGSKEINLISFIQKPEQALFIEEKLKKHLKIKNFALQKNDKNNT